METEGIFTPDNIIRKKSLSFFLGPFRQHELAVEAKMTQSLGSHAPKGRDKEGDTLQIDDPC